MRGIIHDQVSHRFIEGPIQPKPVKGSSEEWNNKKVVYRTDLTQGYDRIVDKTPDIYNRDIPYLNVNEEHD